MHDGDSIAHLSPEVRDRYLDEELAASERERVRSHLAGCARCRREVAVYRSLLDRLDRLPVPEPPPGFDVRILDAVLPRPSEAAVLMRLATRVYAVLTLLLAGSVAGVLAVWGAAPFEDLLATGIAGGVSGVLGFLRVVGVGFVDLMKTVGDLIPLADAAGALVRGLETAASSLAPQVVLLTVLTLSLATLVLVWALAPARERGVPHVSLTL